MHTLGGRVRLAAPQVTAHQGLEHMFKVCVVAIMREELQHVQALKHTCMVVHHRQRAPHMHT